MPIFLNHGFLYILVGYIVCDGLEMEPGPNNFPRSYHFCPADRSVARTGDHPRPVLPAGSGRSDVAVYLQYNF